jgi:hypothetical protein
MSERLDIRAMTRQEVHLAVDWADREGWNPGLHDATVFHGADPEGFLIARLGNEPVAVCSAVRHGDAFGFFGFYIVAPHRRGQGHGLTLWQAAMQRLKGRVVGLDGVVAQQHNYARSGFVLAYRQVRYAGRSKAVADHDKGLRPLHDLPPEQWLKYDRLCFPSERRAYIEPWVRQPGTVALALVDGAGLCGYGAIRPCRRGFKVGPLFADDAAAAERLLRGLQGAVPPGAEVFLDVPMVNREALALAERQGMTPVFETARMYAGAAPGIDTARQFGVTSFELG